MVAREPTERRVVEGYMTTREAAEKLGSTMHSVANYVRSGKLLKGKLMYNQWWVENESVEHVEYILKNHPTCVQVAAAIGMSTHYVQKKYKDGVFQGKVIFGTLYIHPSVLDEVVKVTGGGKSDVIARALVSAVAMNTRKLLTLRATDECKLEENDRGILLLSEDGNVLYPWGVVLRVDYKPSLGSEDKEQ